MRTAMTLLVASLCVLSAAVVPAGAAQASTDAATGTTAPPVATDATTAQANNTTVTILSYNDIQTAAAENDSLPRLATLVAERRAAHDNPTFVFGAGDEVSPHSLSPLTKWQTPVDALNVIDPDAEAIGNHDLDFGFEAVANFSEASTFPWLMANIVDSETGDPIPGTEPYTVVEKQGVRVGVIGLADQKIKPKTAVDFAEQGYELRDYAAAGSEYATQLRTEEDADVVVVLGHFGVPVAKQLANETENVDAVLVGDDEIKYPPAETNGVVISEGEARANYLGELNLTVSDGAVTDWEGRLIDTQNATHNETVSTLIEDARGEELARVAGRTETTLDARFASNYHDETALGNLVTDAFRAKTGADVAATNAGGIRSNSQYGPGNVTAGNVYNMLPFNNHLVTMRLTGSELTALLESQVETVGDDGAYDPQAKLQVSGVTYEWATHADADSLVRDVSVNGTPVAPNATYNVTVNSYMAGWDSVANATVLNEEYTLYGTVLFDYIDAQGTVSPADTDRIRRVDATADAGTVSLDGAGDAAVSFAMPSTNATVDTQAFYALNAVGERVNATRTTVSDNGTVSVVFPDSSLRTLAADGDGDIDVYGHYSVAGREYGYFNASVVNADVTATMASSNGTATTVDLTAETDTTTTPPADTDAGTGLPVPGFGIGVAVLAVFGAALLASRR
ncbi:5'-nucleotidase C-terminal domain-containing protein [Halobacterium salinarum]|uniref:5'-nucleotidase C-terminal domain-containing protein n=1 Tax=Halobacterium TaxID=2239 RepID=UPI001962BD49|nr:MULTISPECIES: 5'-nucleotidase C-terminal domain-containing protein [Halobacterium]MDL0128332.1 5'-nucleotidase C-terminal domain-containing protein [Halobacterium salinarum]MDL0138802.1 5'-nucleotidase C-terminal domain-containing protein [Halobacterium salinarum]QRY21788.1 5'-nucleotidase C-terminal domain-containing protein [Halobacterium sp. GSL-19]WJK63198.1 5'-nucleotidase C-terminal domain-containing protein [Halobacterium salinarum]